MDLTVFFPDALRRDKAAAVAEAVAVCATCPVRTRCLEEHIDERFGVWGGTSAREREGIRRQRRWVERDAAHALRTAS